MRGGPAAACRSGTGSSPAEHGLPLTTARTWCGNCRPGRRGFLPRCSRSRSNLRTAYWPIPSAGQRSRPRAMTTLARWPRSSAFRSSAHKKLKAVWAAMMDNKREQIKLPFQQRTYYGEETKYLGARRLEGKGRYRTFWNREPLPERDGARRHQVRSGKSSRGWSAVPAHCRRGWHAGSAPVLPAARHGVCDCRSTRPGRRPSGMMRCRPTRPRSARMIVKLPSHGCQELGAHRPGRTVGQIVARCAGASGAGWGDRGRRRAEAHRQRRRSHPTLRLP